GRRTPSALALDPRHELLYAVNEVHDMGPGGNSGAATAFAVQANGKLTMLNQQLSGGADPAHLSVDPRGHWVLVANYSGSTVEVLPIMTDGSLGPPADLVKHTGPLGPNAARQQAPHPHMIGFDPAGNFVLVPDLGLD